MSKVNHMDDPSLVNDLRKGPYVRGSGGCVHEPIYFIFLCSMAVGICKRPRKFYLVRLKGFWVIIDFLICRWISGPPCRSRTPEAVRTGHWLGERRAEGKRRYCTHNNMQQQQESWWGHKSQAWNSSSTGPQASLPSTPREEAPHHLL